jgi:hypothetical protein
MFFQEKFMASISNLTTVPKITSGRGPLKDLYVTEGVTVNRYPEDLETDYKSHFVQFNAYKIQPLLDVAKSIVSDSSYATTVAKDVADIVTKAGDTIKEVTTAASKRNSIQDISFRQGKKVSSIINLFIPDTLNFQYNASYGELTLKEAAESLPLKVGTAAQAATSLINNRASKLMLAANGLTFNPGQQLLFEGIDFRTYQMSFTFTPASSKESDQVRDIIKKFRMNAAPTLNQKTYGMFFVPPSVFEIKFFSNGQENMEIPRLKPCVIKDIDVNYAPNGWAAHTGGAPVQTVLTMTFQETSLIDSVDVEQGY